MGWYFSPQSRSELIAELIAPQETERIVAKAIAHALRGNVLWSVVEMTAKVAGVHRDLEPGQSLRYIRCDLLE
ncbi:SAM-dependent DNA methyltransferase, partial [Diaphorobacter sp. DS2]